MPSFRKKAFTFALAVFGLQVFSVPAQDAKTSIRPGIYNEGLGSSLELKTNGRFDWRVGPKNNARVVGAWVLRNDRLILNPDIPTVEKFTPLAEDAAWSDMADEAVYYALFAHFNREMIQMCPYLAQISNAQFNMTLMMGNAKIVDNKRKAASAKKRRDKALQQLQIAIDDYHALGNDSHNTQRDDALKNTGRSVGAMTGAEMEYFLAGGDATDKPYLEKMKSLYARCWKPKISQASDLRYAVVIESAPGAVYAPELIVRFRMSPDIEQIVEPKFHADEGKTPSSWAAWSSDVPVTEIELFWRDGPKEGLRVEPPPPGRVRKIVFDDLGGAPVFDRPIEMQVVDRDLLMIDTGWRYEWRRSGSDEQ